VVAIVTKNNALEVIMEGTKNEELMNVHVVAIRTKPIDLDKNFEGNTLLALNKREFVISHGYPMRTSKTKLSICKSAIL
jgi:hypothetical protein